MEGLPGLQGLLLTSMRFKPSGTTISTVKRAPGGTEGSVHWDACLWFNFCPGLPAQPGLQRGCAGAGGLFAASGGYSGSSFLVHNPIVFFTPFSTHLQPVQ